MESRPGDSGPADGGANRQLCGANREARGETCRAFGAGSSASGQVYWFNRLYGCDPVRFWRGCLLEPAQVGFGAVLKRSSTESSTEREKSEYAVRSFLLRRLNSPF